MTDGIKAADEVEGIDEEEQEARELESKGKQSQVALQEAGIDVARPAVDVHAEVQSPEERRHSAARTLYEWERASLAGDIAMAYMAELAGLSDAEVEHVCNVAERDEYNRLGLEDEEDAREAGFAD